MAHMHIEMHDQAGHLAHSAILTVEEVIEHYPKERITITGFMSDDEAASLTYTERGLAHLDG